MYNNITYWFASYTPAELFYNDTIPSKGIMYKNQNEELYKILKEYIRKEYFMGDNIRQGDLIPITMFTDKMTLRERDRLCGQVRLGYIVSYSEFDNKFFVDEISIKNESGYHYFINFYDVSNYYHV